MWMSVTWNVSQRYSFFRKSCNVSSYILYIFRINSYRIKVEIKYGLLSKHFFQRKPQYCGWLKKSHSNDKFLEKITSCSYHMEQKTFIEASCIYNIHTGEKSFCSWCFWRFVSCLDSGRLKKLKCTLVCTSLLLLL